MFAKTSKDLAIVIDLLNEYVNNNNLDLETSFIIKALIDDIGQLSLELNDLYSFILYNLNKDSSERIEILLNISETIRTIEENCNEIRNNDIIIDCTCEIVLSKIREIFNTYKKLTVSL